MNNKVDLTLYQDKNVSLCVIFFTLFLKYPTNIDGLYTDVMILTVKQQHLTVGGLQLNWKFRKVAVR